MKKLLFAVSALAALSLLAPSTGIAQHVYSNQCGLYEFSDGTGSTGTFDVGSPVTIYLVLTKPTDELNGEAPYETINAFECTLNFNPIGNMFKLGEVYAGDNVDVGDSANIGDGYLEYIVGYATDHPVTDLSFTLLTLTFMHTAPGRIEVTLGPSSKPSIPENPDNAVFQSVPGDLRVMYSAAGSNEAPIFVFDGDAVAVENESFGSVKALYR